jgi:hypothetical protein
MGNEMPRDLVLVALFVTLAACGSSFSAGNSGAGSDASSNDARSNDAGGDGSPSDAVTGDGKSGDGGPGSTILAHTSLMPLSIAVDDTTLYWVAEGTSGGSVLSMPKGGGAVSTIAHGQSGVLDIAIDTTTVYWSTSVPLSGTATSQCLVNAAPKEGGASHCLLDFPYATTRMTTSAEYVALLATDPVGQQVLGGVKKDSLPEMWKTVNVQPASAVVATDTEAYIGDGTHVDDYTIPGLAMGPAVCQASCGNTGSFTIADIVLDTSAANALWATSTGAIVRASVTKPTQRGKILTTVDGAPQRLARDTFFAYVTSTGTGPVSGYVSAVSLPAGTKQTLAKLPCGPFGVATDGTKVYFTCDDGTVRSVEAPPALMSP